MLSLQDETVEEDPKHSPNHEQKYNSSNSSSTHLLRKDIDPRPINPAPLSVSSNSDQSSDNQIEVRAKNIRARERLQTLRDRVARTRALAIRAKQDVQKHRERYQNSNARFMEVVDQMMTLDDVRSLKSLHPYYFELKSAQDELGPLEAACDSLEIRLQNEEQSLEQEEESFYKYNTLPLNQAPNSGEDTPSSPLTVTSRAPQLTSESSVIKHELTQEYFRKVSEAENIKEYLQDLEDGRYKLLEEAAFRQRHGLSLSSEGTKFLADFSEIYNITFENLQQLEKEILNLEQRCLEAGFFDETQHKYEVFNMLADDIWETILDVHFRSPFHAAAEHLDYDAHETNFVDKHDYVNNWMLDWVKDSPLEALRLRTWVYSTYPEIKDEPLDSDRWAELALLWWHRDEAAQPLNISERDKPNKKSFEGSSICLADGSYLPFDSQVFVEGTIMFEESHTAQTRKPRSTRDTNESPSRSGADAIDETTDASLIENIPQSIIEKSVPSIEPIRHHITKFTLSPVAPTRF
ncbi:hypothetical protein B0O99DRAFT_690361 [Bisporella sp. PMI_857]|nr:hypothetical protein B0O99DRAFT_690361 [Bisporella sp. PMI_857]